MKYQSIYDSPRQRVAKNPLLAGLVSAAVIDIWRNVIKINPDWDELTIIPHNLKVGSSTQLMALSLDGINQLFIQNPQVEIKAMFERILSTIEAWDHTPTSTRRVPSAATAIKATEVADYLPVATISLSINPDLTSALEVFKLLQENFNTNYSEEIIINPWTAVNEPERASSLYENLDEIILDFDTFSSSAMVQAFSFGLKNGLMNFFNVWPSRIDMFLSLEKLAIKVTERS
jgi:hypothetical protein